MSYKTSADNNYGNKKLMLSNFVKTNDGIYVPSINSSIDYNDGDKHENYIISTLEKSKDKGLFSTDLQKSIIDWPSEYHFSPYRASLIAHLPFKEGDKVLELGSGCGAITRFLCEKNCRVTAIEGSIRRAKATRIRCDGFDNLRVYSANFFDVEFTNKFDWILLVGVLEYSGMYSHTEDPFNSLLSKTKALIKDDGNLLVAIENRLGLKYFGGCNEDHIPQKFFGIEDRYTINTPKTFGKNEITNLIKRAGYKNINFQFPFPDYKLPRVILTEEGAKNDNFLSYELIRHLRSRDYSKNSFTNFDESLVWPQICKNNLIQELSNSFLIIANSNSSFNVSENLLAVVNSFQRHAAYAIMTKFILSSNKKIDVVKEKIEKNIVFEGSPFSNSPKHISYLKLQSIHSHLIEAISKNEFYEIEKYLTIWQSTIKEVALEGSYNINGTTYVSGNYFDLQPNNILIDDDIPSIIDEEWCVDFYIPLPLIAIRYFRHILKFNELDKKIKERLPIRRLLSLVLGDDVAVTKSDLASEDIFRDLINFYISPVLSIGISSIGEIYKKIESKCSIFLKSGDIENGLNHLVACATMLKDWKLFYEAALLALSHNLNERIIYKLNELLLNFSNNSSDAKKHSAYITTRIIAREHLKNNKMNSAISSYKSFIDRYTEFALAHNDLGVLYFKIEKPEKALSQYRKAIKIDRKCINALKNLGDLIYFNLSQHRKALSIYKFVLKLYPDDQEAKDLINQITSSLTESKSVGNDPLLDVSIIIPVFNQLEYTKNCIDSLLSNREYFKKEIVVIDNGSTDGTIEYLTLLGKKITAIFNHQNLGFVDACNQGSQMAKGKYLVFLNNDTLPLKGWISPLVEVAENDSTVGAVGAKLIYPNGKLQEAGGIVLSNGRTINFGRNDDPTKPIYNQVCEVDYCSGACLLVRKDLFSEIGGFDRRYAPAYYEETDLCFELRKLNFKVVYQPKSEVIHYGSVTAGNDDDKGFRKYLNINRQKFTEKWQIVLKKHERPLTIGEKLYIADRRLIGLRKSILLSAISFKSIFLNPKPIDRNGLLSILYGGFQNLLKNNHTKEAWQAIKDLVDFAPDFALAHNDMGVIHYRNGNTEKAAALYTKAVELEPTNLIFRKNLADLLLFESKQTQRALKEYMAILKIAPNDIDALFALGHISLQNQQREDAIFFFRRILEIDPSHEPATTTLAQLSVNTLNSNTKSQNAFNRRMIYISPVLPRHDSESADYRNYQILDQLVCDGWEILYLYQAKGRDDDSHLSILGGQIEFIQLPLNPSLYLKHIRAFKPDVVWITNLWTIP